MLRCRLPCRSGHCGWALDDARYPCVSGVQQLTVTANEAGQRLDRWLRRHFPHIPQGRIEKLCRKGEIRIDGGRVKAATRVKQGQAVRIPPLPAPDTRPAPHAADAVSKDDAEAIQAAVLYRDDHLIALNKPPRLALAGRQQADPSYRQSGRSTAVWIGRKAASRPSSGQGHIRSPAACSHTHRCRGPNPRIPRPRDK